MSEVSTRYVYYFEGEALDEDDMPENVIQHKLSNYLEAVLSWYFRFENHFIIGNVNVYRKGHYNERVAPDVMVVKNIGATEKELDRLKSYAIAPPKFPPPAVAIEILSAETAPIDINPAKKPTRYGELGVKEYFVFDPEEGKNVVKLRGWRYIDGLRTELHPDGRGWLWSNELACWLVPDDMVLQFYDRNNERIFAKADVQEQARLEAEREAETERQARLEAEREAETERQARLEAEHKAETERQARLEAERTIAALRAKLTEKEPE
jgi:Uma2 family endonuclease